KRRNISKNAIIVSTGPSLMKQLPLLKEYREKALIFCADSAYPILAKHNIKPDFVCMVERSDFTAEFFNHDFGDFDEGVCFI
ncbi:6-hydroxymethylpterin diphosphokinase MptE-like protein, partial [Campylobacter upsaliensis]